MLIFISTLKHADIFLPNESHNLYDKGQTRRTCERQKQDIQFYFNKRLKKKDKALKGP